MAGPLGLDYPRAVLAGLGLLVAVALVVAASTSAAAFGAFNPAWDGATDLQRAAGAAGAEGQVVRDADRYAALPPNGTVAVVLAPDRPYGPAAAGRARSFVRAGGTLVVADDFGAHANDLLAAVGARSRIDGRLLRDERFNYRSPAMPIARNASDVPLAPARNLTLNHGTVLRPNGATVLVRSSGYAYLDANRNGDLDADESLGSYPVATVERVGAGRVVVVSDPSAFVNAMLDRPGNAAFVRALFARHERVALDYSHAGGLPPLAVAVLVLRESPPLGILLGAAALGAVGLWTRWPDLRSSDRLAAARDRVAGLVGRRRSGSRPPGPGREAMVRVVERRHPDWDEERVERVVRAVYGKDE